MLARAALEGCQRMNWSPDIVHCHDWHAALAPAYMKSNYSWDGLLARSRSLITIHNIAYQGVFDEKSVRAVGLADRGDLLSPDGGNPPSEINFLRSGILLADGVSTVSPTHAVEIQTAEYGMGLEGLLRSRAAKVTGILNGVDYEDWTPESDPLIRHVYSPSDLAGKAKNKRLLVETNELEWDPAAPVVGIVSRLVEQKGIDLMFSPLPEVLHRENVRLILLGTGEARYEEFFERLQSHYPEKVSFRREFNQELAHRIVAGSDLFLMPSRYEPCGLTQMYCLKYGTVPLVRKTGGLADSVTAFDEAGDAGTGFVFERYAAGQFEEALREALDTYARSEVWERLMLRGMEQDFSWDQQTVQYEELYRSLL